MSNILKNLNYRGLLEKSLFKTYLLSSDYIQKKPLERLKILTAFLDVLEKSFKEGTVTPKTCKTLLTVIKQALDESLFSATTDHPPNRWRVGIEMD